MTVDGYEKPVTLKAKLTIGVSSDRAIAKRMGCPHLMLVLGSPLGDKRDPRGADNKRRKINTERDNDTRLEPQVQLIASADLEVNLLPESNQFALPIPPPPGNSSMSLSPAGTICLPLLLSFLPLAKYTAPGVPLPPPPRPRAG